MINILFSFLNIGSGALNLYLYTTLDGHPTKFLAWGIFGLFIAIWTVVFEIYLNTKEW